MGITETRAAGLSLFTCAAADQQTLPESLQTPEWLEPQFSAGVTRKLLGSRLRRPAGQGLTMLESVCGHPRWRAKLSAGNLNSSLAMPRSLTTCR
jgi:hypothetical protein